MVFLAGTIFHNKEGIMLTIVFIKRHMQAGAEKEFFALIKKLRSNAMGHDGYISGETLVSTDDPQELLVISRWQSREDWAAWKESDARKSIDTSLEKLQTKPTEYKSYVFNKFRLSVQSGFPKTEGKA
jgi:heme-degrading monooxygenase HmoA